MTAPKAKRDKSGDISRSQARLATVQALYQMDLAETDLVEVIEEFKQRFPDSPRASRLAALAPLAPGVPAPSAPGSAAPGPAAPAGTPTPAEGG